MSVFRVLKINHQFLIFAVKLFITFIAESYLSILESDNEDI